MNPQNPLNEAAPGVNDSQAQPQPPRPQGASLTVPPRTPPQPLQSAARPAPGSPPAQAASSAPAGLPPVQPASRPVVAMSDITPNTQRVTPTPAPTPPAAPAPSTAVIPPAGSSFVLASNAPKPSTSPGSEVSFQPASPGTPPNPLIERIDETPQQNSHDIEQLINRQHRFKRLKSFASFLLFIVGVIIAVIVINQYIFQSYYVDGTSMTPTLHNDDRLIIDKVEKTFANVQSKPYIPERGQIVVLDSSIVGIGGREEQLIKRVIGIPGDTLTVRDGVVTVKNKDNPDGFDVDKRLGLNLGPTFSANPIEITIPDGQVYVMGDNRVENGSYDSRAFGPVESSKLVGRLWARILPVDKAQIF